MNDASHTYLTDKPNCALKFKLTNVTEIIDIMNKLKGQTRVLKIGVFGKLIKIRFFIIYYIIENSLLLHEFVFKYVKYI